MKMLLLLSLFSTLLYAQKTEVIDLSKSIKSEKTKYRSFTVIDQRATPEIGSVMYHKNQVNIIFEKDAATDLKSWFYRNNPVRGDDDLVFLIENITVSEDVQGKFSVGKLEVRASTFIKKQDGYHFISKKDTVATISSRNTPYIAQSLAKKMTLIFTDLFKDSYRSTPWEFALAEEDLRNYKTILKENSEILKTEVPKDGVYKDFYSFTTQNPEPGFVLQYDKKGIATKAVNGDKKIWLSEMYAFVHDGIPYKIIPVGYVEIYRDHEGLFIDVKKEELFPESSPGFIMVGGGVGGLIGSAVANIAIVAIDRSRAKKRQAIPGAAVSLDPLTGNYILPEDFGNTKKK